MVSFTLTYGLTIALAAFTTASPARRSLPAGQNAYLALNSTSGSLPLYAVHDGAGTFDLVFRPGAYYEGTPAIIVNSSYVIFDTGDNLPYGLTQPGVGDDTGAVVAVTAQPGVGTGGFSIDNAILEPKLFAADELWVACGNTDQYTWEFAAPNGALPDGCEAATVQVYTRI